MSSTGETLVDLRQRVDALQRNLIMPAYIDIMAVAQQSSPAEYLAITGVRRRMLDSALATGESRSKVLHEALERVRTEQREARTIQDPTLPGSGSGVIANVDGTFIDRVVEQAVRSRDVEYRRELSDRCVDADLVVVDQKARTDFERWLSETIEQRRSSTRSIPTDAASANQRLISLSNQIADLADRTREILVAVSRRNLNPASVLYQGDIAPVVTTERPVSTRNVAFAGVGFWFVLLGLSALAGVVQDRRRALA
ncbi:MAG: hypothetical protein FJ254_09210 [Phycisphaerae bacterium]|nr:hypothetical protein [Phycisphaerae bacterium]